MHAAAYNNLSAATPRWSKVAESKPEQGEREQVAFLRAPGPEKEDRDRRSGLEAVCIVRHVRPQLKAVAPLLPHHRSRV